MKKQYVLACESCHVMRLTSDLPLIDTPCNLMYSVVFNDDPVQARCTGAVRLVGAITIGDAA